MISKSTWGTHSSSELHGGALPASISAAFASWDRRGRGNGGVVVQEELGHAYTSLLPVEGDSGTCCSFYLSRISTRRTRKFEGRLRRFQDGIPLLCLSSPHVDAPTGGGGLCRRSSSTRIASRPLMWPSVE